MATSTPRSPNSTRPEFSIPIPPLHPSRPERNTPSTPTGNGFTTPVSTPQGSPSKSKLPPGAKELPNVFENAMKLEPTGQPSSPPKLVRQQLATGSPNRGTPQPVDEGASMAFGESVIQPGSPRRGNKENTPPVPRVGKEYSTPTAAAISRYEQYSTNDAAARAKTGPMRGLTAEEVEKLQLPKVKRLANVTQIYFLDYYFDLLNYIHQRELRRDQFDKAYPSPETTNVEYESVKAKYLGRERANLRKRRTRLRQGDFQILTQVGQGGYGQVFLASKKDTKEVCALKVMSKKLLFKLDEIRHILTERDILTAAKSEWLVKLLYAFQDDSSIYLAMEYVPGGDFRTLLNNTGVLHNRHARFYAAEMFCCVDALHQLGYIHRDLKPENFLIDATGHVKLTDFGLAAGVLSPIKIESMRVKLEEVGNMAVPFSRPMESRTMSERREDYRSLRRKEPNYAKSIVGSPDYMAPEVLKGDEYDFTVDYWSLGCMLYEAIVGYPPFAGATVEETWQNLRHWRKAFKRPDFDESTGYFVSNRTWDLISRLVCDKQNRFRGVGEIHRHAYFAEVEFAKLRAQRPPFVPELDSETDAGYFDDFTNEADMAKYKEVHDKQTALENMADREEKMNKSVFVGFTFRHRKPAVDSENNNKPSSPRKPVATDGTFGTMF